MNYAVLIYETEADFAYRPSLMPVYAAYAQALEEAGHHAGGQALQPTHTATTLRQRHGAPPGSTRSKTSEAAIRCRKN